MTVKKNIYLLSQQQIVGNMAQASVSALTREIGGDLNTSAATSGPSVGPFTSTSTPGVNQALKRWDLVLFILNLKVK